MERIRALYLDRKNSEVPNAMFLFRLFGYGGASWQLPHRCCSSSGFCQAESPGYTLTARLVAGPAVRHARASAMPLNRNVSSGQCGSSWGHGVRPDRTETGFSCTIRNIYVRVVLIFKYFIPFCGRKTKSLCKTFFFFL